MTNADTTKPTPRQHAPKAGERPPFTMPEATPPDPPARGELAAPKPSRPTTLAEAATWLLKPFPESAVELKPGATNGDKTRALGMPYVDMRLYFARLDKICGCENWSSSYTATDRGVVCALTIFGVTKSAIGDYPKDAGDENPATSAEAQAFKRACSAFGLGRYLYSIAPAWGDYDKEKKRLSDPAGMVAQMYHAARLANGASE